MSRIACYIDGFNLYHAIDAVGDNTLKWLNLNALAKSFLRPSDILLSVVYFTAHMTWDNGKYLRHKEYLRALKASGVECIVSKFQQTQKHCQKEMRYCKFNEEKQTDVAFATRALADCILNQFDRVIFVTADSDQVPTVAAIRGMNPKTSILVACPPGRFKVARELAHVAGDAREITVGRLRQCLFPRDVVDAAGKIVARSPAKYQPPRF